MGKAEEFKKPNIQWVLEKFGFKAIGDCLDLRSSTNSEVIKFFHELVQTDTVVLHGTSSVERFDSLEARQAHDAAKESGNKKAVYATTNVVQPIFLAILNKHYLRTKFKGFTTGWGGGDAGKMIFKLSPNIYELWKNHDPNIFSDGYIYVLDKSKFINAEDAGDEWHSEVDQKPLLACHVSGKLADEILNSGNVIEHTSGELSQTTTAIAHQKSDS